MVMFFLYICERNDSYMSKPVIMKTKILQFGESLTDSNLPENQHGMAIMIYSRYIVTIIWLCCFFVAAGRNYVGKVTDSDNEAIAQALVTSFSLPDTTYISMACTDAEGGFIISIPDEYSEDILLTVEAMGFRKLSVSDLKNIAHIQMESVANNLGELVVRGRKSFMKTEAGRYIYDPSELKYEAFDAIQVMERMPLLSFKEKTAYIFGKGEAKILINGKEPKMSQESLIQYLRSIPVVNIQKVEVVVNPGVYQASSDNRGIVNIIITDPTEGLLSSSTIGVNYDRERFSPEVSEWLAYSKGRFKISFSPFFVCQNSYVRKLEHVDFFSSDRSRETISKSVQKSYTYGGTLNLDYTVGSKLWIGAYAGVGNYTARIESKSTGAEYVSGVIAGDLHADVESKYMYPTPSLTAGIYAEWYPDSHSTLEFNADFGRSETRFTSQNLFNGVESSQYNLSDGNIVLTGIKYRFRNSTVGSFQVGYDFNRSKMGVDDENSVNSIIECINSAYVQYNRSIRGNLSVSAGLRMENYNRKTEWTESGDYSVNQLNFFPSASISWSLDKHSQSISLNYSRKSSVPSFWIMNPARQYTSEYAYSCGNPFLKLGKNDFFSLYYRLLDCLTISSSYMLFNDGYTEFTRNDGDYTVTGYTDSKRASHFSASMQFNKKIMSFLRLKLSLAVNNAVEKANVFGQDYSVDNWIWNPDVNLYFMISQKMMIGGSVSYSLYSPSESLNGKSRWKHMMSANIYKVFGNWGRLALTGGNLLDYTQDYRYRQEDSAYRSKTLSNACNFSLSMTINLGNFEVNTPRTSSNSDISKKMAQ